MKEMDIARPSGAHKTTIHHRVAFHETDAMGVVHHAKYLLFFEEARVAWMQEQDRPYTDYIEIGRNFAVTRAEVKYQRSSRFYEQLDVTTALLWVHGASVCFVYEILHENEVIVTGLTEHALVNSEGRPRRIPKRWREQLYSLSIEGGGS